MCKDCWHEWLGLVKEEARSVASHVQIPNSGEKVTYLVWRSTTDRHWRWHRREQLGPAVATSGGSSRGRRMSRGMIDIVFGFSSSLCALTAQRSTKTLATSGSNKYSVTLDTKWYTTPYSVHVSVLGRVCIAHTYGVASYVMRQLRNSTTLTTDSDLGETSSGRVVRSRCDSR